MPYDNNNRGVLFKNDRKTSDKQPDYKGDLNVGGVVFEIAAWIKEAKETGKKYMSLSIQPKREG